MSGTVVKFEKRLDGDAASIIKCMNDIIEQVKEGNIASVAVAAVETDGSVWTVTPPGDQFAGLIGAVRVLEHRLLTRHIEASLDD